MKSVRIAIGIAAAMAVTSVGFEARAQFITRDECERNARAMFDGAMRENSASRGPAFYYNVYKIYLQYDADMALCAKIKPRVYGPPVPPQNPFPMPVPKPEPKWPARTL
jgi:hypothetical protein